MILLRKNYKIYFMITLALIFIIFGTLFAKKDYKTSEALNQNLSDSVVLLVGSSKALLNDKEMQIEKNSDKIVPYVKEGRTLVPVRFITEALGASVNWDDNENKAIIMFGDRIISFVMNSDQMEVNGDKSKIYVPAQIQNSRIFVPLRTLMEALNKKVFYDRGLIIVSDTDNFFEVNTQKNEIDEIIKRLTTIENEDEKVQVIRAFTGEATNFETEVNKDEYNTTPFAITNTEGIKSFIKKYGVPRYDPIHKEQDMDFKNNMILVFPETNDRIEINEFEITKKDKNSILVEWKAEMNSDFRRGGYMGIYFAYVIPLYDKVEFKEKGRISIDTPTEKSITEKSLSDKTKILDIKEMELNISGDKIIYEPDGGVKKAWYTRYIFNLNEFNKIVGKPQNVTLEIKIVNHKENISYPTEGNSQIPSGGFHYSTFECSIIRVVD